VAQPCGDFVMSSEGTVSLTGRVASSSVGAVLTSLVLTPFDVVKTRLQGQLTTTTTTSSASSSSEFFSEVCTHPGETYHHHTTSGTFIRRFNGLVDTWCYECESPRPALRFHGTIDAALKIMQYEGPISLWRGWTTTLLRSVPQVIIYFSLYDHFRDSFHSKEIPLAPFWAGSLARTFTTFVVSPIELVRTKQQSLNHSSSILDIMRSEINHNKNNHGIRNLWRGVTPTLMRDVPFSAIYWTLFEYTRNKILSISKNQTKKYISDSEKKKNQVLASFMAGASSGMIAATLTHPFDLVKTRKQIELYQADISRRSTPSNTLSILKTIIKEEGYRGLLTGLAPRVAEIAPACAIMISSYEIAKSYFKFV